MPLRIDQLTAIAAANVDPANDLLEIGDVSADGGTGASRKIPIADLLGTVPVCLTSYDAEPAGGAESNIHGGLLSLATGQALDASPTNITVSKGTGKLLVVVNSGTDTAGSITVTGTSVDRNTGATTASDTDTLTVSGTSTDNSSTDTNGNTKHAITAAYLTSKWFAGTVTLSTTDLTLTDVDVYHVSFEQFGDAGGLTLQALDANLFTTNANAEFDAYLYTVAVTGGACAITLAAELHVGADGEPAIANKYWRLRRGNLAQALDGANDGVFLDVHYSNAPAYVEDVTLKVWADVAPGR